ncbi:MAG: C4-dicarboxylate TRAP transporter substrate-binding protein [Elusimicrobiota bacterium]|jgi:tripartite ATP-independent transporter DctP family solute receptor|nr:C4-dicarboxylate TRAP transporter substrate-binding protein [Elusimicrobiota bacterium]
MKKVLVLMFAAVIAFSLIACGGSKKETTVIKLGYSQGDGTVLYKGLAEFAKLVKERSKGRLEVQIFTSNQLGSDEDVIEQLTQGGPIALLTDSARMSNYVKDMGILMMGYFADNYDECLAVTQSESFAGWSKELAEKNGIRVLAFNFYDGPRDFYVNEPVNTPADLKGQRIRTIGSPVCTESIRAMGATPISMAWGDSYNAIQSGAIEGVEAQATAAYPAKLFEVTKYIVKTDHFQLLNGIIISEEFFQTLSPEDQQLLIDACQEAGAANARAVEKAGGELEASMVKAGITIIRPNLAPFKAAVESAYQKLGYDKLRDKIYKEIGKK